jgi:hypothetical protein
MHHLEAAAQLFKLRRARGFSVESSSTTLAFHRVVAESFLYHVATMSLLHEDLNRLSAKFSWADLEYGLNSVPFPDASTTANSPIIGQNPGLYQLMFDITRLSSLVPLQGDDYLEALKYQDELRKWSSTNRVAIDEQGAEFVFSDALYIISLQIFLLKLLYPEILTSNPHIQLLIQRAIVLIRGSLGTTTNSIHLCWPIFILACSIDSPADMLLLKEKLVELWKGSLCGQVRRWATVIGRMWKVKEEMSNKGIVTVDSFNCSDGLDLLIHRKSFLSDLKM